VRVEGLLLLQRHLRRGHLGLYLKLIRPDFFDSGLSFEPGFAQLKFPLNLHLGELEFVGFVRPVLEEVEELGQTARQER
jgi:hypothetical protein